MNEAECITKMVAPGTRRKGKYREGVIQVLVTRACTLACKNCTQNSQLAGKPNHMPVEMFKQALDSLKGYFGVIGMFGGCPTLNPNFKELCKVLRESWVPKNQRGIWVNDPITVENAQEMRATFDPSVSNLNVHLNEKAYRMFKHGWPECNPVGLKTDSRHSPCYVAMKDVLKKDCEECPTCKVCGNRADEYGDIEHGRGCYTQSSDGGGIEHVGLCEKCKGTNKVYDEPRAWELISNCDVNRFWSASIGMFRGQLRAWFCEIAMAQSILHQDDLDYPDTGHPINEDSYKFDGRNWWQRPMDWFAGQVRKHCHECSVPLRGHGAMAQGKEDEEVEQVSETHKAVYRPKRKDRKIELVTVESQLGQKLNKMTDYIGNAKR